MNSDLAIANTPAASRTAPMQKPAAPAENHAVDAGTKTPDPPRTNVAQQANDMANNVQQAVDRLNEQMRQSNRGLNFSIDRADNRTVITVKNSETGEVIRQIPDERLLRASHSIEALKGMLHNETT